MNRPCIMTKKNLIRVFVLTALLAWPAVETIRLIVAQKQLAASAKQFQTVQTKLAQVKGAQVAAQADRP